uniref:Uncharacterized protein n=1 Tax=Erpetoichthys calabaricus TaxID=27687 RepID=A0A8C4XGM2_ERPCA
MLNSPEFDTPVLNGRVAFSHMSLSSNRSVMTLDVWGCMCATLSGSTCVYLEQTGVSKSLNPIRDGDRGFQLFSMNEEFPVSVGHKLALIKSLPFVHIGHRNYQLDGLVRASDWSSPQPLRAPRLSRLSELCCALACLQRPTLSPG